MNFIFNNYDKPPSIFNSCDKPPIIFNQDLPIFNQDPPIFNQDPPIFNQDLPIFNQDPPIFNQDPPIFKTSPFMFRPTPPNNLEISKQNSLHNKKILEYRKNKFIYCNYKKYFYTYETFKVFYDFYFDCKKVEGDIVDIYYNRSNECYNYFICYWINKLNTISYSKFLFNGQIILIFNFVTKFLGDYLQKPQPSPYLQKNQPSPYLQKPQLSNIYELIYPSNYNINEDIINEMMVPTKYKFILINLIFNVNSCELNFKNMKNFILIRYVCIDNKKLCCGKHFKRFESSTNNILFVLLIRKNKTVDIKKTKGLLKF